MIKVDKHISELLYKHDCVIVPELGGFVANYASAKIHPTQHTFNPPSKKIVFNKNLKTNDGLLVNHVANEEKISYSGALNKVALFTSTTSAQLKKGIKVNVEEVGILYLDTERNIQFEPSATNYLLDAFGLSQFQSPVIKRDNIGKRIEKEFKDRGVVPAEKKKTSIKRYVALALALPLIFAMIWIPLKTDILKNINYSGFNPFAKKEITKNGGIENTKLNPPKVETIVTAPSNNINDTLKTTGNNLTGTISQPITAAMVEPKIAPAAAAVKADSTSVAVNNVITNLDLKFHLITGCFQIQDNANRFVIDLQNQNITASIIGKRGGLYIVSSGDYATRKEAFRELKHLKKSQPDAWLLKK